MSDIAKLGVAIDTKDAERAKAVLERLVPAAAKAEKASLALAKADYERSRATLAAMRATGSATKEEIAAASALVKKANAAVAASRADLASAAALSSVDKAARGAAASVDAAGAAAAGASGKLNRLGSAANDNLNAVQATPANIAAQFQDIGVTAAAGMNPLLIALQQGTQLSVAFSGGLGGIGAALKQVFSPMALLTIAAVALGAYLIQMAMGFFETGDAAKKASEAYESLKFASDGVSDAQTILGKVFDLSTGKMERNTAAAVLNARAQLMVMEATSRAKAAEARGAVSDAYDPGFFEGNQRVKTQIYNRTIAPVLGAKNDAERAAAAMKAIDTMKTPNFRKLFGEDVAIKSAVAMANLTQETLNVVDAQKAMADLSKGTLSDTFLKPDKPKKDRASSGKSDGEKLIDVWTGAEAEIATENSRKLAAGIEMTAEQSATMAQRTKLMNELQTKGLPITDATVKKVDELAAAFGHAKYEADKAAAMTDIINGSTADLAALDQQIAAVGVYGRELAYAAAMAKMLADAKGKGMTDSDINKVTPMFNIKAGQIADKSEELRSKEFMNQLIQGADERNRQLKIERAELGLTGTALVAYRYESEMLLAAERAHIELSPERLAGIKATASLFAEQSEAIRKSREQLEFNRESTRSFFKDFVQGARDGQGAWGAFSSAFENFMDKLIDKLLNDVLDAVFQVNSAVGGNGGGGLLGSLGKVLGIAGGGISAGTVSNLTASASGTIAANPSLFAKGDAFTNSVVSRPTAFAFGKGGSNLGVMGEAGDEAVMPLQRGPDGSLGVQMYGNGRQAAAAPQEVVVKITADDERFNAYVDGRITTAAPQIAQAGSAVSQRESSFKQTRRLA